MNTTKSKAPEDQLSRLREQLVEDVMSTTDEEIVAELKAAGDDPEVVAARMRDVVQRAVIVSGKVRMAAAKTQLRSQQSKPMPVTPIDIARARRLLQTAAAKDNDLRLTLAARNGEAMSDSDVQSLVQDLIDLGLLTDDK